VRGKISHWEFCTECDVEPGEKRLEDTGDTFGNGFGGYTIYRCPSCGQTYRVEPAYQIIQRDTNMGYDEDYSSGSTNGCHE